MRRKSNVLTGISAYATYRALTAGLPPLSSWIATRIRPLLSPLVVEGLSTSNPMVLSAYQPLPPGVKEVARPLYEAGYTILSDLSSSENPKRTSALEPMLSLPPSFSRAFCCSATGGSDEVSVVGSCAWARDTRPSKRAMIASRGSSLVKMQQSSQLVCSPLKLLLSQPPLTRSPETFPAGGGVARGSSVAASVLNLYAHLCALRHVRLWPPQEAAQGSFATFPVGFWTQRFRKLTRALLRVFGELNAPSF